jgi:hypothetical protein
MISGKYVHLIETHWESIIARIIDQIRREPELAHLHEAISRQTREWGEDLLEHLGHWLTSPSQQDLVHHYEHLGKARFEEAIPLCQCVRAVCIMREKTLEFIEEHVASNSSVELYAEEELDRRLGRFFDVLLVHMVRGYEREWHKAKAASAA